MRTPAPCPRPPRPDRDYISNEASENLLLVVSMTSNVSRPRWVGSMPLGDVIVPGLGDDEVAPARAARACDRSGTSGSRRCRRGERRLHLGQVRADLARRTRSSRRASRGCHAIRRSASTACTGGAAARGRARRARRYGASLARSPGAQRDLDGVRPIARDLADERDRRVDGVRVRRRACELDRDRHRLADLQRVGDERVERPAIGRVAPSRRRARARRSRPASRRRSCAARSTCGSRRACPSACRRSACRPGAPTRRSRGRTPQIAATPTPPQPRRDRERGGRGEARARGSRRTDRCSTARTLGHGRS